MADYRLPIVDLAMPQPCAVVLTIAATRKDLADFSMPWPCVMEFHGFEVELNVSLHSARPWQQREVVDSFLAEKREPPRREAVASNL